MLALLCGLLSVSDASHARQAGPGAASTALEEVIVTATKREKAAQDVGKSINVFGSEALDRAGVDDVSRLALITPGLGFAQRGNDFKLTLRGANSENTDRAEPPPIPFRSMPGARWAPRLRRFPGEKSSHPYSRD